MITTIRDAGISCGFVARAVTKVRDVRLSDDVVIDPHHHAWVASSRAEKFRAASTQWHTLSTMYVQKVGPKVEAALSGWIKLQRMVTRRRGEE